jgi:hypothetical protein
LQIHRTLDCAKGASDALVLADDANYWRRLHQDQPRAIAGYDDQAAMQPLVRRFEELWEASEPAQCATTLGL